MKALLRRKKLLMIFLVVLMAAGVLLYIKPRVEKTIIERQVAANKLAEWSYCQHDWFRIQVQLTPEAIPSTGRQQMYSNLDNKIEFTINSTAHTSNTSFRIKKVFYKSGGREIELDKEDGTVWNATYPQSANENKITLNLKGSSLKIRAGTIYVRLEATHEYSYLCDPWEGEYSFEIVQPYYNFEGTFNLVTSNEGNPSNEENEWAFGIDPDSLMLNYNETLDTSFRKIEVTIRDSNNRRRNDKFIITYEPGNYRISIKNRSDNRKPDSGRYSVEFRYNDPNFSTSREGDVEKLYYKFDGNQGIEIGNKRLFFKSDWTEPEVHSYRFIPTEPNVDEIHTIEISSLTADSVTWAEYWTDVNFGTQLRQDYTKTREEFAAMYAAYPEINISNIKYHPSDGAIAIPLIDNENTVCYKNEFYDDGNNLFFACYNSSGDVNYQKYCTENCGSWNANWVDLTGPVSQEDRNHFQNGYDLGTAGRYVASSTWECAPWGCSAHFNRYTYTYKMQYTKQIRKATEDRTKMDLPLVTDGGAYYFQYQYKKDIISDDALRNPELKIFNDSTQEEIPIAGPNPSIFKVNWNTDERIFGQRLWHNTGYYIYGRIAFDIRFFDDTLPAEEIAKQYEGTYYLSIKFNEVDEQRVYFTISSGESDFYIQSSVDRHESTNHLKEGNPPTNMYYEWNLGFFIMHSKSISNTKNAQTITAHIYDRQIRLKNPNLLNEKGLVIRELTQEDFEYYDSINYTMKIITYKNHMITFAVKEEADNGYNEEVALYNSYDENDNITTTYSLSEEDFETRYGEEALDLVMNFYNFDVNGNLITTSVKGPVQILYTIQVEPQVVEGVEVPGGNMIYYTLNGVADHKIMMDPTRADDFASTEATTSTYAKIAKHLQFSDPDDTGKSYLEYGVISGVRTTTKDINNNPITGNDVSDQFDIYVDPSEENIEKPVSILPLENVEINPGTYYVYVSADQLIGAGYIYKPGREAIPSTDYPEMMNVNVHEAKIIYDKPKYSPRLQDPKSSNSGNDQQRMYYNADSEAKLNLEMGDIKFFDNGSNGVTVGYKYEFLAYDKVECREYENEPIQIVVPNEEDPEHPEIITEYFTGYRCTDKAHGVEIDQSTEWDDITTEVNDYITVDPITYMSDAYIHSKDMYGNETAPYILLKNRIKSGDHAGEFSPMGYYRVTWYYKRDYRRVYSVPGASAALNPPETVYGLDPNTGEYGTSTIISNVSKFYGIDIQSDETIEFTHNFHSEKIIDGSLYFISDPTQIQIGGEVFLNEKNKTYQLRTGTQTITDTSGTHQVNVLMYYDSDANRLVEDELMLQYKLECKYEDTWEDCINVADVLDQSKPGHYPVGSIEYEKYLPYLHGVESQEMRIRIENTKNFTTRKMITPIGTYDITFTYEEPEVVRPFETIEEATAVVEDSIKVQVLPDSFNFLITSQNAILTETEQYIEIGVNTQYINEEDLDIFDANVSEPDEFGNNIVISDTYDDNGRCNAILCLEQNLIDWEPHTANSDPDRYDGVMRIHINPDRMNEISKTTYYRLELNYNYNVTGKRSVANINMGVLLNWQVLPEYPVISGTYTDSTTGETVQLDKLHRNIPNTTVDIEIEGPHKNNVSVVIVKEMDCPAPDYECNPVTLAGNNAIDKFGSAQVASGKYFDIVNTTGADNRLTLTYHAYNGTYMDKGSYLILLYYSDSDKQVVPLEVYNTFVRLELNAVKSYTTANGLNHDGIYLNRDGNIEASFKLFGITTDKLSVKMYNSNNNSEEYASNKKYLTEGYSSPFRFARGELPGTFHIAYSTNNGKNNVTSGTYVIKFYDVTNPSKPEEIVPIVKWVNNTQAINQLNIEVKEKYFDFDFYRNSDFTYQDPVYDPNPLYPNQETGGSITYKLKADALANNNSELVTVVNQIKNSVNIVNVDNSSSVKNLFTVTAGPINSTTNTDFWLKLSFAKNKIPEGTYELSTLYSVQAVNEANNNQVTTTRIERKRQFSMGAAVKFIKILSSTIDSSAYDGLLHSNIAGTITAKYTTDYPLDMDHLTVEVKNSNGEAIGYPQFMQTINANTISVRYDPNEGRLPVGEYRMVITYDENPIKTVEVEVPFTMYAAYEMFEISDMQTTSAVIYADREGQEYTFSVDATNFTRDEKRMLKARVFDDNDKLIYSDYASDNDKFESAEARTAAFRMTNNVLRSQSYNIGINAYKAQVGTYYIQLFLDETGHDYYVSNQLQFTIDDTENEITISNSTKITPINDIKEDGTVFDMDGAHVKALFYPSTGFDDLSYVTLKLMKDDVLIQEYDQTSGNFQIVQDDYMMNNIKSEFNTGALEAGSYKLAFCLHGLEYNQIYFEVEHYIPVSGITVMIGGTNLTANPIVNRVESPNVAITISPANATLKNVKITVANTAILNMTSTKLTPKTAGVTQVTVTVGDKSVSGNVSIVDGLSSNVYEVVYGSPGYIFVKNLSGNDRNGIKLSTFLNNVLNKKTGYKVLDKDGKTVASSTYSTTNTTTNMTLVNGDGTRYQILVKGDAVSSGAIKIGSVGKVYRAFKKTDTIYKDPRLFKVVNVFDGDTVLKINDVGNLYRFFKGTKASI